MLKIATTATKRAVLLLLVTAGFLPFILAFLALWCVAAQKAYGQTYRHVSGTFQASTTTGENLGQVQLGGVLPVAEVHRSAPIVLEPVGKFQPGKRSSAWLRLEALCSAPTPETFAAFSRLVDAWSIGTPEDVQAVLDQISEADLEGCDVKFTGSRWKPITNPQEGTPCCDESSNESSSPDSATEPASARPPEQPAPGASSSSRSPRGSSPAEPTSPPRSSPSS